MPTEKLWLVDRIDLLRDAIAIARDQLDRKGAVDDAVWDLADRLLGQVVDAMPGRLM